MTDFFEIASGLARREAAETLSRIEAEAALTRMIAGCEAFKAARQWDYSRFTRGERFVYQPLPSGDFDMVMEQVQRWKLDDYLKERSFEKLLYRAPT